MKIINFLIKIIDTIFAERRVQGHSFEWTITPLFEFETRLCKHGSWNCIQCFEIWADAQFEPVWTVQRRGINSWNSVTGFILLQFFTTELGTFLLDTYNPDRLASISTMGTFIFISSFRISFQGIITLWIDLDQSVISISTIQELPALVK